MRKLDTSFITDTVGMKAQAGVFDHLQLSYQEVLKALAENLVGPGYQTNVGYILYGCVNTGSGLNYVISAGAIFYNGEVYLVPAITFTASGGQVAVASITTGFYTNGDRADPVGFTDASTHNVLQIRTIGFASGSTGSGIFDFSALKQTSITLANDQQSSLPSSYTLKFDQDKAVFFASAPSNCVIGFDFTNAIPGAVVRLKWAFSGSETLTVTAPSGSVAYKDSGDLSRVGTSTNVMYFIYTGVNESGLNEVSYTISQV